MIIDRFEGGFVLLENPETLEVTERPRGDVPRGAREGDALIETGGVLRVDQAETQARAARIKERFDRLRKKGF